MRAIPTALFLLSVAVYLPVWPNEFVRLDDPIYISENVLIRQGLTVEGIAHAFTTFDSGNWIPLTWLSFECDASLFGVSPVGSHAVNILLHSVNVVLLYLFLNRSTGAAAPSAFAAAMFAVHPLHVESVAWASERKDVLSTFWLLLTLLAYRRYASRPTPGNWLFVTAAFACGLLSKSMLVTLPVLLLLLDWWPLQRTDPASSGFAPARKLLIEKLPWLAMSLVIGIVAIIAQRAGGAFGVLPDTSFSLRIATAVDNYGWYLWKTVCPTSLCAMYYHPLTFPPWGRLTASLLVCGGLAVASIVFRRRRPAFFVGWWWFVISLLPVIGLLQVGAQSHADRYAYVPHIGLLTGIAFESADWLTRVAHSRWLLRAPAAAILLICGTLTVIQIPHWRTTERLWMQVLAVEPQNWLAISTLSSLRIETGKYDEAFELANRAIQLRPDEPNMYRNLGQIWLHRGSPEQADAAYRRGIEANPDNAVAWSNLSEFQRFRGDLTGGAASLARSIELEPRNAKWHNELGLIDVARGHGDAALNHFLDAVDVDPTFSRAHYNASILFLQLKRPQLAKEHLLQAVKYAPFEPAIRIQAGLVMEADGDLPAAKEHFRVALLSDPSNVAAREGLKRTGG